MAKLNNKVPAPTSATKTTGGEISTHEGGIGFERDYQSELFLLGISYLAGETSFYESASVRDTRFQALVQQATANDPAWTRKFIAFLRNKVGIRTASVIAAAEYARAGGENKRQVIASSLQRPDEVGEFLSYWKSVTGKATLPGGVQRGLADCVNRMYSERNVIRWDSNSSNFSFADAIKLTHAKGKDADQNRLFDYLTDAQYNSEAATTDLSVLSAHAALNAVPKIERNLDTHAELISTAQWSWEQMGSWLPDGWTAKAWEQIMPQLGYMALIRNLRNMEEAGCSKAFFKKVAARISDPDEVVKSKQFPFRFWSAYKNCGDFTVAAALEEAIEISTQNIPQFDGNTIILIDCSGSMTWSSLSGNSSLKFVDVAQFMGSVFAGACETPSVYGYHTQLMRVDDYNNKMPALRGTEKLNNVFKNFSGGTNTHACTVQAYNDTVSRLGSVDRVVILTDEQTMGGYGNSLDSIPCPIYTWNLAGYGAAQTQARRDRVTFGGFSDASIKAVGFLDRGDWTF